MGRLGITEAEIRQTIQALENAGAALTVSSIRDRLGSGSFSTISAVLQRHREERDRAVRAAVPELPQPILGMFEQLWAEAWRGADAIADVERQAHAQAKLTWEKSRLEMQAEIERLENALAEQSRKTDEFQRAVSAKAEALQSAEVDRSGLKAAIAAAQNEVQQARDSTLKLQEQLTGWIERASRAEAKLEGTAKSEKSKS